MKLINAISSCKCKFCKPSFWQQVKAYVFGKGIVTDTMYDL